MGDPGERTEEESVDERFRALLEGLRTTLPGSQVLLGFLLILPFSGVEGAGQVALYVTALTSAALASVLLIAPSVHQRMRAPISGLTRHTERHLRIATWLTIAGTVFLGIATSAALALAVRVVVDDALVVALTIVVSTTIVWSWAYLPLVSFSRDGRDTGAG